jgi:iron(III) transport system ATP-binding protein
MTKPLVEVNNIFHSYGSFQTLKGVKFSLKKGQIACVLGPSGGGKSTLLRCIAGFESINDGNISLGGRSMSSRGYLLPPEKRKIGFVFQDFALFPHLSVRENILFPLRRLDKKEAEKRCDEFLAMVELGPYKHCRPDQLSGGQQQRVALARALVTRPDLLLFDEPFSNLDPLISQRIKTEMRILLKELNATALIVTHNQDDAFDLADEMGVMQHGELLQWDGVKDIYFRPKTRDVAEFVGQGFFLKVTQHDGVWMSALGRIEPEHFPIFTKPGDGPHIVFIRPEQVRICAVPDHQAVVVACQFRGAFSLLTARLIHSKEEIQCFLHGDHSHYKNGETISLTIKGR